MQLHQFCKELPKIELHAHLNGSLSETTLKSLGCLNENISEYHKLTTLLQTTDKTLDECFELFKIAQGATVDQNSVYLATKSVIQDFHNENVVYLELRTTPRSEQNMSKTDYIESVVKAIKDNELSIIVKLILSIDRRHDSQTSMGSMKLMIRMKNKYPDIIKGVDLSGNPTVGYFDKNLFDLARSNALFTTIHCAEVKNDEEVHEILEFKPDRIGHATCLNSNYDGSKNNWELYCRNKIPVECCLTSNVVCGTTKSFKDHHVQEWIKNSLPFCLSTDDKGVFCTSLTEEFVIFSKTFGVSLDDLWTISYNSVEYTFASTQEKIRLKEILEDWKSKNVVL